MPYVEQEYLFILWIDVLVGQWKKPIYRELHDIFAIYFMLQQESPKGWMQQKINNKNHTLLPLSTAIFSNLPSFVSALHTIFPVVSTLASWHFFFFFFCAVWFLRFTLCMLLHMSFSLDVLPITSMIIFVSCDLVWNTWAQQVQRESVWRISRSFIYFFFLIQRISSEFRFFSFIKLIPNICRCLNLKVRHIH